MQTVVARSSELQASDTARIWLGPLLVGFGVYLLVCIFAQSILNDGDTLTHIVIGRSILEHVAIPFRDPLSFTAHGQTWVPHEWLAEIVFAAVYVRLGWGGVVATTALATASAFTLLTCALVTRFGARRSAIAAAVALLLCEGHLLARPHVLAWPLLIIWMTGIIRARDADRVPSLALLPVMVVWSNLHGGFVAGLGMAGLLAIEAVFAAPPARRLRVVRQWGTYLGLAAASALISPNGLDQYLLTFKLLGMQFASSHITEWRGADFSAFQPIFVWIALMALGGFALGIRLPLSRLAMLLLLLYLALAHIRHAELLAFIGPLLVAAPIAKQLGPTMPAGSTAGSATGTRTGPALAAVLALTIAIALGFLGTAVALDRRGLQPPEVAAPVAAVEAARVAGLTGNVLNSIRFGGYLEFVGIPVFIDGRADLFGDAFIKRYYMATSALGDGLPGLLNDYNISWTIFEPLSPAVTQFAHLPDWERIYADQYAVLFRRKS